MIIVNQEKDCIVNFNNVANIYIENPLENDNGLFSIQAMSEADNVTLGYYKTEERAKEILREIVQLFTNVEYLHIVKSTLNNLDEISEPKYILNPVCRPKLYYMPED